MTHGEEPGPETHTDSAVLTYLEGLLMHPVAAGPGATATRRAEAAHGNQDQGNKAGRPFQLPSHGPATPKVGNGPSLGASKNLKKARLLRSGVWNEPGNQRLSSPPAELNGQGGGLQNGAMEGSPHAGESTLLASLLQSFSSRLQSVALSQHSVKPPGEHSPPLPPEAPPAEKEGLPCYGTASSRLKGLMKKNKLQSHGGTPYSRQSHGQERPAESPRSAHGATPPAAAGDSCAERLKAVANLVKIRSSPAPSPKPSVACSQLALLLSSEAHLQQYSREHALKAQLSGRSASERLAAMATQQGQDKRPPSVGEAVGRAPDPLGSLTGHNGTAAAATTAPRLALSSSQRSPSLLQRQSSPRPTPPPPPPPSLQPAPLHGQGSGHSQAAPREKRGFDARPARPPQTCSSLLLLLLNNHNSQKQLTKNGHVEEDCGALPPSRGSSVTSDSECSTQERSLTKESSDADSSYSSCSPIDLSMRGRANVKSTGPKPTTSLSSMAFSSSSSSAVFSSAPASFSAASSAPPASSSSFSSSSALISSASTSFSSSLSSSTSSLDKLTESLINKWKPEASGPKLSQGKELETSPGLKHHSKVTLMQLLLERRNNDKVNKLPVNPDLTHNVAQASMPRGLLKGPVPWEEVRTESPLDRPGPPAALPLFSLSRDPGSTPSPFSYPSPHVQSSPLDLCKSKAYPVEKAPEPAFSASKLLQNLAQCGTGSPSPPMASAKGPAPELDVGRPLALLERLNAPLQRTPTATPLSDAPTASMAPFGRQEASPLSSQIENLLERRTVLQLLLGTGSAPAAVVSRKSRSAGSGRRSVEAGGGPERPRGTSVICDSSKEPPVDVKVKTEPPEEPGPPPAASEASSRKRLSPHDEPQQDLKTEPRPDEVIAKYGLLSQLLKQQTATYYTSAAVQAEPRAGLVKEEQREYLGPSPKKRRFCPELADSLNNGGPPRALDSRASSSSLASAPQEVRPHRLKSPKEEVAARSPPEEALPRESRGFNVLKQLLLSDNCLKELAQQPHGPAPSPSFLQANGKANGSLPNQPAYNHDLLHLPWQPHSSFSSGLPNHLRPLPTPPTLDCTRQSPWNRQADPHTDSPGRDSPAPVKREPESPVRWYREEEEEGCDSSPDSPRLTRSNPILYYMLQKGSAQLRRDMREQAEGAQSGVKVKEEPVTDMHAYEHRLSSTQHSPPHNDKHSHKSQRLSQSSDKW
ncbi:nuclear receptor-interacting protein 1 [Aplochiton taeniatus]